MKTLIKLIRYPFEIFALLVAIEKSLKNIECELKEIQATQKKFGGCMDDQNHRGRMAVRTAHWND